MVRRLVFKMAPPDSITLDQLESARDDQDGWVRAAAAIAGVMRKDRWEGSDEVLRSLDESDAPRDRAAAAWAAAFVADGVTVVKAMGEAERLVRLEGIRAFARMTGGVPPVGGVPHKSMRGR